MRDQTAALSEACERGPAEAMREGKERQPGVRKVAEPSGKLRRAVGRRLTGADNANFIRELLVHSRELLNGVRGRTLTSAELHHVGGNVQETTFSICDKDRCEGR